MKSQCTFKLLLIFCASANLSGCAVVESIGHTEALAAYAESVFRRQNAMTTAVMMLYEDEIPEESELSRAETAMYDACRLLNEYSTREMEGESMGVLFRRKVKASLKACDQSIQTLESLLDEKN